MTSETRGLTRRHEFVLYFDVTNGNPNGDPDAGNMPRLDPETNQGLVSDVALKRKIRNYVALARPGADGHEIYMRDGATLNTEHKRAWAAVLPDVTKAEDFKKLPKEEAKARELTAWMCAHFWDIRAFGAVMTTGVNAGQVRGPVQLSFARSIEPILPLEISITRLAATTEADTDAKGGRTMGRKHIVPYGLYRAHGYVSAPLASHPVKGTGFSDADLDLLFEALDNMFEHDRSATRGEMATRRLIVFRHATALGNAKANDLFDRVRTWRVFRGERYRPGDDRLDNAPPARSFDDYAITIDRDGLPEGIEIIER
ncbi:MAG: type I-C CRISPR-associated protein Cas7/Csd2 [Phreatobacter sp.]